jgi:HEAT repeat protein
MRGKISIIIAMVLLGCFFFSYGDTTEDTKSLIDAEPYMKELRDPDPEVRRQAAVGLGLFRYRPAVSGLIELLSDQEANKMAAKALRTINDPRGIAAIEEYKKKVNRCNQPLLKEDEPEMMEANADKEFSGMPIALLPESEKSKKIEELWTQFRNSKDPSEKARSLSTLGRLEDPRIFDELGSDDYEIKRSIFDSLKYFHSGKAVTALISALQRFPGAKQNFRGKHFFFTDPALADTLRPLLSGKDETLLSLAMNSLVNMGESLALDSLRTLLLDITLASRFPMMPYELKRALSNLDARPRKDLLIDLTSSDPARRYMACDKLAGCRVIEVIAPMVRTIFDPVPKIRERAIDVLNIWKRTLDFERPIPPPGFIENSSLYDFETGFYVQLEEELKKLRKSPEWERMRSNLGNDFKNKINQLELLTVLGDDRFVDLGRELLKQVGANDKKVIALANAMSRAKNAALNRSLIELLSKGISSFNYKNKDNYWALLELIDATKDADAIPLWVDLMKKACSTELDDNKLAVNREILIYATLQDLLELGDRRVLSFVSDIYARSEERNRQLARQILLKIDYAATKSRLMKEINIDDYILLADLAEAAIREKDRELALYLMNKNPSTHLILQMADLLPNEYLNRPATIVMIGKDIDSLFFAGDGDDLVMRLFSRLERESRWHLCEKGIVANSSEKAPSWLRNELVYGGHLGAIGLIVRSLGDPELKTERKIFLIDVAGETCSDEMIAALSKLLSGSSSRLCESAAKALAKIGNQAAIQALLSALLSDRLFAREYAADELLSLNKGTISIDSLAGREGNEVLRQWQGITRFRQKTTGLKLDQPSISAPAGKSDQLASLVIVVENGIEQLELDPKATRYMPKSNREAASLRHLAIGNNRIIAANSNRVFALDKNLNSKAECVVPNIAAIAPSGSFLFAAAGGHMLSFDEGLNLISKIGLDIPGDEGEWKNAHDIIVRGGNTHLIDDVSYPYYVVQIDSNHPTQPKILSKQKVDDINQHLSMQFISEKDGTWNVVQDQFHTGGKFQNLLQYSLSDGQLIRRLERKMEPRGNEDPEILAVTPDIPGWAVTAYGEHIALVKIENTADFANPTPFLYLGMETDNRYKEMSDWFGNIIANISQQGKLLYITANRQLWVIRTGETPQIILHQILDKPVIKLAVIPE